LRHVIDLWHGLVSVQRITHIRLSFFSTSSLHHASISIYSGNSDASACGYACDLRLVTWAKAKARGQMRCFPCASFFFVQERIGRGGDGRAGEEVAAAHRHLLPRPRGKARQGLSSLTPPPPLRQINPSNRWMPYHMNLVACLLTPHQFSPSLNNFSQPYAQMICELMVAHLARGLDI
jgi:hypothetical protein